MCKRTFAALSGAWLGTSRRVARESRLSRIDRSPSTVNLERRSPRPLNLLMPIVERSIAGRLEEHRFAVSRICRTAAFLALPPEEGAPESAPSICSVR